MSFIIVNIFYGGLVFVFIVVIKKIDVDKVWL